MRRLQRAALAAALVIAPLTACPRTTRTTPGAEDQPTWVRVENQSVTDATIYVWQSSVRLRLGIVNGVSKQTMQLPRSVIFGPTPLRFQVDFLAGNRSPITETITVVPGDTVFMQIPPGS
jgi:hypothetical protein